jgi:hypothetical protein
MNRSLLVLGISALLLGTAACSKQEAANNARSLPHIRELLLSQSKLGDLYGVANSH